MHYYVLGFAFSQSLRSVALIKKIKPDWQKDKLNGIGGSIEFNEAPLIAMIREFREETSLQTEEHDWKSYAFLYRIQDFEMYVYRTILDFEKYNNIQTVTEEKIVFCDPKELPNNVIPNLRWLIPMAIDYNYENHYTQVEYK